MELYQTFVPPAFELLEPAASALLWSCANQCEFYLMFSKKKQAYQNKTLQIPLVYIFAPVLELDILQRFSFLFVRDNIRNQDLSVQRDHHDLVCCFFDMSTAGEQGYVLYVCARVCVCIPLSI